MDSINCFGSWVRFSQLFRDLFLSLNVNSRDIVIYSKERASTESTMDGEISNDAIASLSAAKLSNEDDDNTCGIEGVSSHSGVCNFCTYNYDRQLQEIDEGLYLGSLGAAHNRDAMKACNVTHVLTVASSRSPTYPNDFTYKIVEVLDRDDVRISLKFEECFAFIDEAKAASGGVLVHCFAGKSRSATIVIAYLMYKRGLSLSKALKLVKAKRPLASPNSGFLLQLKEYETSLRGTKLRI